MINSDNQGSEMGSKKKGTTWAIPPNVDAAREAARLASVQFEWIGRFIHQFSQLQYSIRTVLGARIGLDQRYLDIITGPYDFRVLCTVTEKASIVADPSKKKDIEKLFKECLALNEKRVLVAHAMWFDEFDGLSARTFSRNSLQSETHSFKSDELERFAAKGQELMQRVMGFQGQK
jgi:hypothetical protein